MKTNKFKVWDKENKKMYPTEYELLKEIHFNEEGEVDYVIIAEFLPDESWAFKELKNIKLIQYTTLKDINGKEIYEGDIVIDKITEDRKEICIVEWSCNYNAGFNLRPINYPNCTPFRLGLDLQKDYEIIGNIFENPELLEQK